MRREAIEMSYFATCGFCSEIIVAELMPARGQKPVGSAERHSFPVNDNLFRVFTQDGPATQRSRGVQPAA